VPSGEAREEGAEPAHVQRSLDHAARAGEHDRGVRLGTQRLERDEQGLHRDAVDERRIGQVDHEVSVAVRDTVADLLVQLRGRREIEVPGDDDDRAALRQRLAGHDAGVAVGRCSSRHWHSRRSRCTEASGVIPAARFLLQLFAVLECFNLPL